MKTKTKKLLLSLFAFAALSITACSGDDGGSSIPGSDSNPSTSSSENSSGEGTSSEPGSSSAPGSSSESGPVVSIGSIYKATTKLKEAEPFDDLNVETDNSWKFEGLTLAANDEISFKVDGVAKSVLSDGTSSKNNIIEEHPYTEAKASVHVKYAITGANAYLHHYVIGDYYAFWIDTPTKQIQFTLNDVPTIEGEDPYLVGINGDWSAKDEFKLTFVSYDEVTHLSVYNGSFYLPYGVNEFKFAKCGADKVIPDDGWESAGSNRTLDVNAETPAQEYKWGDIEEVIPAGENYLSLYRGTNPEAKTDLQAHNDNEYKLLGVELQVGDIFSFRLKVGEGEAWAKFAQKKGDVPAEVIACFKSHDQPEDPSNGNFEVVTAGTFDFYVKKDGTEVYIAASEPEPTPIPAGDVTITVNAVAVAMSKNTTPDTGKAETWISAATDLVKNQPIVISVSGTPISVWREEEDSTNISNVNERPSSEQVAQLTVHNDADDALIIVHRNTNGSYGVWVTGYEVPAGSYDNYLSLYRGTNPEAKSELVNHNENEYKILGVELEVGDIFSFRVKLSEGEAWAKFAQKKGDVPAEVIACFKSHDQPEDPSNGNFEVVTAGTFDFYVKKDGTEVYIAKEPDEVPTGDVTGTVNSVAVAFNKNTTPDTGKAETWVSAAVDLAKDDPIIISVGGTPIQLWREGEDEVNISNVNERPSESKVAQVTVHNAADDAIITVHKNNDGSYGIWVTGYVAPLNNYILLTRGSAEPAKTALQAHDDDEYKLESFTLEAGDQFKFVVKYNDANVELDFTKIKSDSPAKGNFEAGTGNVIVVKDGKGGNYDFYVMKNGTEVYIRETPVEPTYAIIGSFNSWNTSENTIQLSKVNNNEYTVTHTFEANAEIKVYGGETPAYYSGSDWCGGNDSVAVLVDDGFSGKNVKILNAGTYTITFWVSSEQGNHIGVAVAA